MSHFTYSQVLSRGKETFTALTVHSASWPIPLNCPNIITVSHVDVVIRPPSFPTAGILVQDASARTRFSMSAGSIPLRAALACV